MSVRRVQTFYDKLTEFAWTKGRDLGDEELTVFARVKGRVSGKRKHSGNFTKLGASDLEKVIFLEQQSSNTLSC